MADTDISDPARDPAAALFGRLRDDPALAFDGPGADATARTGHRRRRTRLAAVVAVVAAVVLGTGFLVRGIEQPDSLRPVGPASTSAPAPTADNDAADRSPLRRIDWANATLAVPSSEECGLAPVLTFTDSEAMEETTQYRVRYWVGIVKPFYADTSDDGVEEAVVTFLCSMSDRGRDEPAAQYWFVALYTPNYDHAALSQTIATIPARDGAPVIAPGGNGFQVKNGNGTVVASWHTN